MCIAHSPCVSGVARQQKSARLISISRIFYFNLFSKALTDETPGGRDTLSLASSIYKGVCWVKSEKLATELPLSLDLYNQTLTITDASKKLNRIPDKIEIIRIIIKISNIYFLYLLSVLYKIIHRGSFRKLNAL